MLHCFLRVPVVYCYYSISAKVPCYMSAKLVLQFIVIMYALLHLLLKQLAKLPHNYYFPFSQFYLGDL